VLRTLDNAAQGHLLNWGSIAPGVSLALVMLFTVSGARAADTSAASPADTGGERLEEIVVTARKREENLQQVPLSIAALPASDLQNRSLENLAQVGQVTPNFTFSRTGNGGGTAGLVYIRGVGQYDDLSTFDPAVGIYIDGVYFAGMQNNDLDTLNIERLEILRGPQGTLFGKNTDGGAINIVTRQPNAAADGLGGHARVTGGSFHRLDALADLNVPLVTDRAAVEMAVAREYQGGYGHDANGVAMGNRNRYVVRAALLLKPADTLSIVLRLDGTHYNEGDTAMKLIAVNPNGPLLSAFNAYQTANGLLPYDNRWASTTDFGWNGTGPNYSRGNLWGTSLTVSWQNAWGTLKSISAYRSTRLKWVEDVDGSPITELDYYKQVNHYQVSQELQQAGTAFGDRLNWVAGLYFFGEHAQDDESADLASLNTAFSAIFGAPFDANFCQCLYIKNESYAGYAQGTYALTDKWHLTVGARYTDDHKRVDRERRGFDPATGIGALLQPAASRSDRFTQVSPRFGLDHQWTPDVMTYVSVAQGFKSGGFNGRSDSLLDFNEYQPEKVWAYEIGLRSDWLDKRLRLNATAFFSDYKDLQVATSYSKLINGAPVPLTVVENIPKSHISGGELELTAVPVTGLKLIGGLGITHARYVEVNSTSQVKTNMDFPNTPRVTYNFGAEYRTPLTEEASILGRIDYTHKTAIETDLLNGPLLRQPPYGLLDARLALELRTGVSVSLFGTNLTNEHYFTGGATNYDTSLGWAFVDMAPPREWGMTAEYRF
jgi:iron complex outermembrane recepter protein